MVGGKSKTTASDKIEEHSLSFGPQERADSSQQQTELGLKLSGTDY